MIAETAALAISEEPAVRPEGCGIDGGASGARIPCSVAMLMLLMP
jgi:hypothetical protein